MSQTDEHSRPAQAIVSRVMKFSVTPDLVRSLVSVITGLFLVIVQAYMSEAQAQPIYRVCAGGTVTQTAKHKNTASCCQLTELVAWQRLASAIAPGSRVCQRSLVAIYIIYFTFFLNLYPYIRFEPSST